MSKLISIGNSQGIRIPKPFIKQAKLENSELEFIIVENGLLITPTHKSNRDSWAEDIESKMHQEDVALLDDFLNDSDLEDVQW